MKIIVPLRPSNFEDFSSDLQRVDGRADMVEIWLDWLEDLEAFLKAFKVMDKSDYQFLAVCKSEEEKGSFEGTSMERAEILKSFLEAGGDYVDLDYTRNDSAAIEILPSEQLILSLHDFSGIPEVLDIESEAMTVYNPAVYKFAVTTDTDVELGVFLDFVSKLPETMPVILTTMGEQGTVGRNMLEPRTWGAFYALDKKSKTASGQLTLDSLSA